VFCNACACLLLVASRLRVVFSSPRALNTRTVLWHYPPWLVSFWRGRRLSFVISSVGLRAQGLQRTSLKVYFIDIPWSKQGSSISGFVIKRMMSPKDGTLTFLDPRNCSYQGMSMESTLGMFGLGEVHLWLALINWLWQHWWRSGLMITLLVLTHFAGRLSAQSLSRRYSVVFLCVWDEIVTRLETFCAFLLSIKLCAFWLVSLISEIESKMHYAQICTTLCYSILN